MEKLEGNRLLVDFHEWAWSLRTQGFPVYAVTRNGEIIWIGATSKRRQIYDLPEDVVAVIREYHSNAGYLTLFVYLISGDKLKEIIIYEENGFEGVDALPEPVRMAFRSIIGDTKKF